jgi:hypothetical protein
LEDGKLGKSVVCVTVARPCSGAPISLIVGRPTELQSGLVVPKKDNFSGRPETAYFMADCPCAAVAENNASAIVIAVRIRRTSTVGICAF